MAEPDFSPLNRLEATLLAAQTGTGPSSAFFDELVQSQVFLLLDREIGEDGRWDPAINLCVLTNAQGRPVVAAFTAPERSTDWYAHLPQFKYGLLVTFAWLMQGLGPEVGVVVNPGLPVGVELGPEAIMDLRQQAAGDSTAT